MMSVTDVKVEKIPPDGGYGWVIVLAYALNNMIVLSIFFNFGLILKEAMSDVNLSHSQCNLILILNSSMGMVLVFLGGPLLRRFGYRKVAVVGAIMSSLSILFTALASSFWMIILCYSIINSSGFGATITSFMVALNSFFKEKRSRAIGVGMFLTGLGAIFMPLLISALLTAFGWRFTLVILSAICLHSLVAACLLRPIKWYLKYPPHLEDIEPLNKDIIQNFNSKVSSNKEIGESKDNSYFSSEDASMTYITSNTILEPLNGASNSNVSKKSSEQLLPTEDLNNRWVSQDINLGSSINIFLNEQEINKSEAKEKNTINEEKQKKWFRKFVDLFELTLLRDPIFVNIFFGMAIATSVENNFSLLLPIILEDMMKFKTEQIARLMSIIGITDTLFRLLTPFIGEWCKKPPRVMYSGGLLFIIFVRTMMLFASSFLDMVFIALAIGVTKGYRTVYTLTVIPSYVPIGRLPFAWGIQMFANGVMSIIIGSVLGQLRETTGAYRFSLVAQNLITMWTLMSWSAEFIYFKIKNKKYS